MAKRQRVRVEAPVEMRWKPSRRVGGKRPRAKSGRRLRA